ncbi:MAG: esterase family protein [Prevotellaceae bacterium]|jgi:S-formylglutathione hydrolase FrmB|nr:esterase family protein [Prevotellaceae bacterium]
MRKLLLLLASLVFFVGIGYAAKVDSLLTRSNVMNKGIKAVVVTPDSYSAANHLPVVYLLHGHGDVSGGGWFKRNTNFELLADVHNVIIVLPDGGYDSWYFDSPIDKACQYESYIIKELIPFIDNNYSTIAKKEGRGITGLSMGGHGALYLAIRHQDMFCVAGSMSGGVDIRPFPGNWGIIKRLGNYDEYPERWEQNTIMSMLHLIKPKSLGLIIDCGTDDFFYEINCKLHSELEYRNIPHDFISRSGGHGWDYWANAIKYQMLYMAEHFKNVAKEKK